MTPATEKQEVLILADKLLDEPNADPDDDLRMLARQLIRTNAQLELWIERAAIWQQQERAAFLAGATAYAAGFGHSGLFSENETLRRVRDEWKPFVPGAVQQAGPKPGAQSGGSGVKEGTPE